MLHLPFGLEAYSNTVPAPQPVAEMLPEVDGHTLFTILIVGDAGVTQETGAVVILLVALDTVLSSLQLQRVRIVIGAL